MNDLQTYVANLLIIFYLYNLMLDFFYDKLPSNLSDPDRQILAEIEEMRLKVYEILENLNLYIPENESYEFELDYDDYERTYIFDFNNEEHVKEIKRIISESNELNFSNPEVILNLIPLEHYIGIMYGTNIVRIFEVMVPDVNPYLYDRYFEEYFPALDDYIREEYKKYLYNYNYKPNSNYLEPFPKKFEMLNIMLKNVHRDTYLSQVSNIQVNNPLSIYNVLTNEDSYKYLSDMGVISPDLKNYLDLSKLNEFISIFSQLDLKIQKELIVLELNYGPKFMFLYHGEIIEIDSERNEIFEELNSPQVYQDISSSDLKQAFENFDDEENYFSLSPFLIEKIMEWITPMNYSESLKNNLEILSKYKFLALDAIENVSLGTNIFLINLITGEKYLVTNQYPYSTLIWNGDIYDNIVKLLAIEYPEDNYEDNIVRLSLYHEYETSIISLLKSNQENWRKIVSYLLVNSLCYQLDTYLNSLLSFLKDDKKDAVEIIKSDVEKIYNSVNTNTKLKNFPTFNYETIDSRNFNIIKGYLNSLKTRYEEYWES